MGQKRQDKPLFSITRGDFRIDTYRGTGSGGQKKNKTSSAVRITHLASKVSACSEDSRSQTQNRITAFERLCAKPEFKGWLEREIAKKSGAIDAAVDAAMSPNNLKIEYGEDAV